MALDEPNDYKFKVGDTVGLIYSDHEEYVFDNPTGVVTHVEHEDDMPDQVTVEVKATIGADRVYLIERQRTANHGRRK
jgi:Ser-tRNA(Ala) deacylase AlaX